MAVFAFQNAKNLIVKQGLLIGEWGARYDTTKIKITFGKTTGTVYYPNSGKHYSFQYVFQNDTLIKLLSNGSKPEYHLIRTLTDKTLLLRPYPAKPYSESINLINAVDFKRAP